MSTAIQTVDREQWLAERAQGIGGSDVGAVFNEGYGCARALAFDKLALTPDFTRTEAQERILRRGVRMEEVIADEYADTTKRKIRRMGSRVSKDYPWMRVNIDRQIVNDERGPGVLECKSAAPWVYRDFANQGLPEQYFLQLQHSLLVTGYKWGAFAVMNAATWEMLIFERTLNRELATVIVAKESEFWNRYIEASREILTDNADAKPQSLLPILQLPPQLDNPRDRRCASCLWRKTCRGQAEIVPERESEYVIDDGLAELGGDYIDALNALERYSGVAEDIKERLKVACGGRQKVAIPSIQKAIRFAWQKGRSTVDRNGLQGVVDLLKKRESQGALSDELRMLLISLESCFKTGQPVRSFYFEELK